MDRVTEENVIAELAGIAFDDGCGQLYQKIQLHLL